MPVKNKALTETTMESTALDLDGEAPVVQCAVNRRINLGNYEHLDLLASLKVPVGCDIEEWRDRISVTIAEVFNMVSQETHQRYQAIKDSQNDGRPTKP